MELSAAVYELSCAQGKKTQTNTVQSVATARTVIIRYLYSAIKSEDTEALDGANL